MRLISILGALGHCAIWKYMYHTWIKGVICNGEVSQKTPVQLANHSLRPPVRPPPRLERPTPQDGNEYPKSEYPTGFTR